MNHLGEMLMNFTIDPENQIITITSNKNCNTNLLVNTLKNIINHKDFNEKFDFLSDCRNFVGPKSEEEKKKLINALIKYGPKPPVKQALVVSPEEEVEAAMVYSSKQIKENCAHTVIFQNIDAAKMWLGMKTDKKIDDIINDGLWAN